MGILVCKTPKGVTGRRGTGGTAVVGGTWGSRSSRSTSQGSFSEQPDQETKVSGGKILMTHGEVWQAGDTHRCQLPMSKK